MVPQLAEIFFNVITPVFGLVLIGYVAGPHLQLETRTLSRTAYFLFVPAFVFNVVSTAVLDVQLLTRMMAYTTAVLATIIALEYDLLPDFVTMAVLFSTLASVLTLPLLMLLI